MNLKSIINILDPIAFWRMDKFGGNNVYDDYGNVTLINHNTTLGELGSDNTNIGDVSTNLRGGYLDVPDTGFLNEEIVLQILHISFNFKCSEEIFGIHPIVSKWFPENQWFLGFENSILVAKVQTDFGIVQVEIDNKDVLYNDRWNHCSFFISDDWIRIEVNGVSQYIDGITIKNIVNIPQIGINSPFMIGGKDSYGFTQDFHIMDFAITKTSSKTQFNDIRPLYILTRDVEERFLDLAPDYYFNIAESFARGEGSHIPNKGTLGSHITGYLNGSDLENFKLVEDIKELGEKQVSFPANGSFVINDTIELDLSNSNETNLLMDYNFKDWTYDARQAIDFRPYSFANSPTSWNLWRRIYLPLYSSTRYYRRYYTYAYDENGNTLANTYIDDGTNYYYNITNDISRNGIWHEYIGKSSTNNYYVYDNTGISSNYSNNYYALPASYSPPNNQTFTSNYFFWVGSGLISNKINPSLGKLALIKRALNSYEKRELKYPESYCLQQLLYNYGTNFGWYSGVTNENQMRSLYSTTQLKLDHYVSNMEFFKHYDIQSNRLNLWNATSRSTTTTGSLQTYYGSYISTTNFLWNFFTESQNSSEIYTLMEYRQYNAHSTVYIRFLCNSRNGEFHSGSIEVEFLNTYNGSFSSISSVVLPGGYHMITLTRNADHYELFIDGKLESTYSTGYTHDVEINNSEFASDFNENHYLNDWTYIRWPDMSILNEIIECLFQGYHYKVSGTTYLQGQPLQSTIHTIDSETLNKTQTNLSDINGKFEFKLAKEGNSSGKFLLSLPVDENATSNVVIHGPYQTSVTYDQLTQEELVGEEVYDMTLDFDPIFFYPINDVALPILDNTGNGYDITSIDNINYTLGESSFEDQSKSINLDLNNTRVNVPSTGIMNDVTQGYTINLWFSKNNDHDYFPLFSFGSVELSNADVISSYFTSNNTWSILLGANNTITFTSHISNGVWYMFTLRYYSDNSYEVMINGKTVYSNNTGISPIIVDRAYGFLGWINNEYANSGNYSNFSLYNYTLPNEELEKMANRGRGFNANTLKSAILYDTPETYYIFDARSETLDIINDNDLSVNGSVDYNKNSVIVNKDVVGNNYMFNNDYHLNPVENGGTIEFSFKTTGSHTQSILLSEWNDNVGEGSYKFQLEENDIMKCYVLDDFHFMTTPALTQGVWHLVILTIVNGNVFNLYVDDVLVDSITLNPIQSPSPYETVVNDLTPLAYYRLGENDSAIDETGNYNGIFVGEPTLGVSGLLYGNSNNAIEFTGTQYIDCGDKLFPISNNTQPWSAVVSVNMKSGYPIGVALGIINQYDPLSDNRVSIVDFYNGIFRFWGNGINLMESSVKSDTTTYHIAITRSATGLVKMYIDNVLESSNEQGVFICADTNTFIGAGDVSSYEAYSIIDEVSIYDKELTQSDVNSLYTSSVAPTYQDVVNNLTPYVYYRLGEQNLAPYEDDFIGNNGDPVNSDIWLINTPVSHQYIYSNTIRHVPEDSQGCYLYGTNEITGDFDLEIENYVRTMTNLSAYNYIGIELRLSNGHKWNIYFIYSTGNKRMYCRYWDTSSWNVEVTGNITEMVDGKNYGFSRSGDTITYKYREGSTDKTFVSAYTSTDPVTFNIIETASTGGVFGEHIVDWDNLTDLLSDKTIAFDEMAIENINIDDDFIGTDNDVPNSLLWKGLDCEDGVTFPKIENNSLRLETIGISNNWCQAFSTSDLKGDFDIEFEMDVSQCPESNSGAIQFRIDWESGGYFNYVYWSINYVDSGKWYQHYVSEGGVLTGILVAGVELIPSDVVLGRMTRVGNDINVYKHNGSDWVQQGSTYTLTSNPDEVYYRLYQSSYSGNPDSIGYVNYVALNSGNAVQNNHGTYLNSPTLGESGLLVDNNNTAVTFDGVDQSINTGMIYKASPYRTWGCLFKSNNVSSGMHALFGDLLSANADSRFTFGMNGGVWYLNIGDGAGGYYVDESVLHNLIIDTTYHIIMVQNGTQYNLYVDGILFNTYNSTADASLNEGTNPVYIGCAGKFDNWYFDGTIDEPFIINRSLIPDDITYLYNISKANQVTPNYTPYEDVVNALTPLAYYRMNDQQINIAIDETGSYNGTYVNSPTLGEGSLLTDNDNTSVSFNGTDQYMNCGNIPISGGSQSFSFLINTTTSTIKHALSKWENEIGNDNSYLFEIRNNAMKMLISTTGGDAVEAQGTIVINDGQTHHIVGVFESATKLAVYIDGELDIETTTGIPVSIHNGSLEVWLSAFDSTPNDLFLAGTLDEVCLFEKALTQEEITLLYRSSKNVGGGDGTPVYGLNRMTIGSDDQGSALSQLASPTWIDDLAFYNKALPEVRRNFHYEYFINKKSLLIGDL